MSKELDNELNKLREQLKLLEELNKLKNSQVDSANRYQNVQEKINKTVELRTKLEQQGLKTSQYLDDVEEKLLKVRTKLNELEDGLLNTEKEREKVNKNITETKKETSKIDKEQIVDLDKIYDKELGRLQNLGTVQGIEEDILKAKKSQLNAIRDAELSGKRISDEEKKRLVFENEKVKALEKQKRLREQEERKQNKSSESINQSINNINIPGIGKVSNIKQYGELSTSAKLITVVADIFNKAVDKFSGLFKDGLDTIARNANKQYQNISIMTGMSYSTYRNGIGGMGNSLKNWNGYDLQNNIRTSDIQDTMNSLASAGVSQENLLSNAVENAITNTVVPYLDISSENFILLNERLGGDFSKQIRGINKANLEIAGNNLATKDILNSMIDLVKPMSDEAIENLAKGSTEVAAMTNKLVKEQGWSKEAATEYALQAFKYQKYGAAELAGGSTSDILKYTNIMNSGYNLFDVNDANNIAGIALDTDMKLMGMAPGYGSTSNGFMSNTIAGTWGIDYNYRQHLYNSNKKGLSGRELANSTDLTPEELDKYGDDAVNDLANDKNQTLEQRQSILMENLSSEIAMWKVDSGVWFDVLTTAVKGIASILLTYFAGKAVSGIGGKLLGGAGGKALGGLSGAGTYLNAGLQQGFAKGSITAFGAGKLGFMSSTGGAIAGGAGILAGGAMAIKGASDVINDFKEGDVNAGTAMSATGAVGGAVGAGSLIALGASNPVGWVALAIGGIAMVGKAAYDSANAYKEGGKLVKQEYEKIRTSYKKEISEREDLLYNIQDNLENDKNIEKARADLINSGMLSEEDMQKAQKASKEELEKLTKQYLISTGKFSDSVDAITDKYGNMAQQDTNDVNKSIRDWYNANKNNKNDTNKGMMEKMVMETVAALEERKSNGASLSEDEQWFLDEYTKNESNGNRRQKDYEWVLDKGNNLSVFYNNVKGDRLESVTRYAANNGANGIKSYEYYDPKEVSKWMSELRTAIDTNDKSKAEAALKGAKDADLPKDKFSEIGEAIEKFGLSYRVGTDSIPFDNYPALLHEGEAVLTASTANELRSLVDEYRETKNESTRLEKAIRDQTTVLVEKLNAIYTKMPGNDEVQAQAIMPGRLEQNTRAMTTPYNQFS